MDNNVFWLRRAVAERALTATALPRRTSRARGRTSPPTTAEQACCCSAAPAFVVVLAPRDAPERPVDLLFCLRHYALSRDGLDAAGAVVLDL